MVQKQKSTEEIAYCQFYADPNDTFVTFYIYPIWKNGSV